MLRRTRNRLLSIMIMNGVSVATLLPWRRGHRQRSHLHHFCVVSPLCERPPRQPRYPFSRHIRQTFLEMAEIGRALVFKLQNGMRREASHVSGRRLFVISLHNLCTCASIKKSSAPICAARCSGEAAAVLMRLTWALSKSFRVPRSCGSKKELVIMLAIRAPRLSRRDFCCGCGSNVLSQSERPRLSRRPAAATALAGRAGTRGTPPTGRRERAACRSISWGIGHPLWCAKASWSHQLSPG